MVVAVAADARHAGNDSDHSVQTLYKSSTLCQDVVGQGTPGFCKTVSPRCEHLKHPQRLALQVGCQHCKMGDSHWLRGKSRIRGVLCQGTVQLCSTLSELLSSYQIGAHGGQCLLRDGTLCQFQHALDAHILDNGRFGESEHLLVVAPQQVQRIIPAVAGASDIAVKQGEGCRDSARTTVGEAAN